MPDDEEYSIELVATQTVTRRPSPWKLPARWKVEIRGKSKPNLRFNAAIARDGHLDIVEGIAPYDKEFTASRLIVLFEPTRKGRLSVVVYSDAGGSFLKHFSHESDGGGRILFDETISQYESGSL